jgi:hypothetical protein
MRTGRFEWRKKISRKQKKKISFLPTAKKWDRKSYTALGNGHMIQNFLFGSHECQSGRYRPDFGACSVCICKFDSTIGHIELGYFFDARVINQADFLYVGSFLKAPVIPGDLACAPTPG